MTPAFWSLLACSAAAVVIPLQYFRRATGHSRRVVVVAVLNAPTLSCTTWTPAFAVQQRLSPNPTAAQLIAISVDPRPGKAASIPASTQGRTLFVPLRISGLLPNSIVVNDRAEVRLVDRDGATLFDGRSTHSNGSLPRQ